MAIEALAVSLLTIGGSSFLSDLEGVTLSIDLDTVRNDSLTDSMTSEQVSKAGCSIETPLMSTLSTPERVSDLQLSAASLGSENLLTYGIESLTLNIGYQRVTRPQAGSLFKYPQNTKINVSGSVTYAVPDTGEIPILEDAASTTYTDRVQLLDFTINSIEYKLPILLKKASLAGQRDGLQLVTAELGPRKPTSGVYPVLPTSTTTLLGKALNAYRVALAIVADTSAGGSGFGGEEVAGNFIFDTVGLEVRDGALVMVKYQFLSQGAFTVTSLAS